MGKTYEKVRVIIPKNLLITIPITEKNKVKGYKKQTETKAFKTDAFAYFKKFPLACKIVKKTVL